MIVPNTSSWCHTFPACSEVEVLDVLPLSSEHTFLLRFSSVLQRPLRLRPTSLPAAFRRALLAALPSLAGEGPAQSWAGLPLLLQKAGSCCSEPTPTSVFYIF